MGDRFDVKFRDGEAWTEAKLQVAGPVLAVTNADGASVKTVVLEDYHFISGLTQPDGSVLFDLHHEDPNKPDLNFAVDPKFLGVIQSVIRVACDDSAMRRRSILDQKKKASTASLQMSGYLNKSNRIRKRWSEVGPKDMEANKFQRRYFVMSRNRLHYYENQEGLSSLGVIELPEMKLVKEPNMKGLPPHAFVIETARKECFILCAENDEDKDEWTHVFKKFLKLERASASQLSFSKHDMKSMERKLSRRGSQSVPHSAANSPPSSGPNSAPGSPRR